MGVLERRLSGLLAVLNILSGREDGRETTWSGFRLFQYDVKSHNQCVIDEEKETRGGSREIKQMAGEGGDQGRGRQRDPGERTQTGTAQSPVTLRLT